MTEAALFRDNQLKPALDWVREAVRRHGQISAEMRRLREQHVRWVAGLATGGIALMVASWPQLTAIVDARWLIASMCLAVLSVAAAATTTLYSIDVDETSAQIDTMVDGFLAVCGQVTSDFLERMTFDEMLRDPKVVQALTAIVVQIARPRAEARERFLWAYRAAVFGFCAALAAFIPALLVRQFP
jgi:hypothetical protein